MRLIDADTLEEKLKDYFKSKIDNHNYEIDVTNCNVELQALLESMPTAYDVDKIVEQLGEMHSYSNPYDSYYDEGMYRATKFENETINKILDKTIEIVKRGGVDE